MPVVLGTVMTTSEFMSTRGGTGRAGGGIAAGVPLGNAEVLGLGRKLETVTRSGLRR